jgi:hypothetical protein
MQMQVPKLTGPMVKLVRTGEGVLVFGANAAIIVATAITQNLSPVNGVKYAVILNSVTVISRSILKAVSATQGLTGVTPEQFNPQALPDLQTLVDAVSKQVRDDLAGASAGTVAGQAAEDIPDLEQLVADAEHFDEVPPATPEPRTEAEVTQALQDEAQVDLTAKPESAVTPDPPAEPTPAGS